MIGGVIFGMKTEKTIETTIRDWIKAHKTPVELLLVRNRPGSFELELISADK
jgi:hypothetical protein